MLALSRHPHIPESTIWFPSIQESFNWIPQLKGKNTEGKEELSLHPFPGFTALEGLQEDRQPEYTDYTFLISPGDGQMTQQFDTFK